METLFRFKTGTRISANAQKVGECLEFIRQQNDGLTPDAVVDEARNKASVLHPLFEWNDVRAAEQYRYSQAAQIIRSIEVVFVSPETDVPHETRAFVSVQKSSGERVYQALVVAMSDADYRRQVLAQAHRELTQLRLKYAELQELCEVFGAVDRVGELLQVQSAAA